MKNMHRQQKNNHQIIYKIISCIQKSELMRFLVNSETCMLLARVWDCWTFSEISTSALEFDVSLLIIGER